MIGRTAINTGTVQYSTAMPYSTAGHIGVHHKYVFTSILGISECDRPSWIESELCQVVHPDATTRSRVRSEVFCSLELRYGTDLAFASLAITTS